MGETKREDDDDHDDHMGITVAKTQPPKKETDHTCVLYFTNNNQTGNKYERVVIVLGLLSSIYDIGMHHSSSMVR